MRETGEGRLGVCVCVCACSPCGILSDRINLSVTVTVMQDGLCSFPASSKKVCVCVCVRAPMYRELRLSSKINQTGETTLRVVRARARAIYTPTAPTQTFYAAIDPPSLQPSFSPFTAVAGDAQPRFQLVSPRDLETLSS